MIAVLFSFRTFKVRTLPQDVVIALTSAKWAEGGRFQIMTLTPRIAGTGFMLPADGSDGVSCICVKFGAGLCETTKRGAEYDWAIGCIPEA